MKRSLALASAVLVAGTLAGCSDQTETYCQSLEDTRSDLEAIAGDEPNLAELEGALDRMSALAQEAPSEIEDEWETVDGALTDARTALDEAGIELRDLESLQSGELPEGLGQAELMELGSKLQGLFGSDFTEATKTIEQHAQDECNIDLSS